MAKFTTWIGEDIPVDVYYFYNKAEPETLETPAVDESVDLTAVYIEGRECLEVIDLLSDGVIEGLRLRALEREL